MLLNLNDIFVYANCTSNSRNVIEREQVINTNQVILCGIIERENVSLLILSNSGVDRTFFFKVIRLLIIGT